MKKILLAVLTASTAAVSAHAQTTEPSFTGPRVGVSVGSNRGADKNVLPTPGPTGSKRSSVAIRGVAGYDVPLGNSATIGGELGIGNGGRDIVTGSGGRQFRTNPGLTFDASARLGVKPTSGVLLFGKAGWAMQRVTTTLTSGTTQQIDKGTEHGFLWGAGAEVAITPTVALRADFDRVSFNEHYKRSRLLAGVTMRF